MDIYRKYLLNSVAMFVPRDPPAGGGGGEDPGGGDAGGDDDITLDADDLDADPDANPDVDPDETDPDEDPDEDPDADPDAGGAQPQGRTSRGERQYGELRRQARERADENARLTRELAELRGQITQLRQPPAETAQQRAERLALMSPEDRIQETVNDALRAHEQRTQMVQSQLMDQADRATFDSRCVSNPLLKKIAPEVEKRLQALRQQGQNLSREVVATYLLGEKLMAQQGQGRQQRRQQRRQQEARPVRAQGDVGSGRRQRAAAGTVEDMESRFGDVPI